jgi:hypothetical protein
MSLASAIPAVLVPRPAGRRRFRQPGITAVILVALTLAFNEVQAPGLGVTLCLTVGKAFDHGAFWWVLGPIYDLAFRAGLAVLSGWLTLVVFAGLMLAVAVLSVQNQRLRVENARFQTNRPNLSAFKVAYTLKNLVITIQPHISADRVGGITPP